LGNTISLQKNFCSCSQSSFVNPPGTSPGHTMLAMTRPAPLHLGETVDPTEHKRTGKPISIDAASLTTHAVIVGQTGSGKTGLGIALIEEVLLTGTPVLLIDPKGDLSNLALRFPGLSTEEFAPWVEGAEPATVATQWKEGLASWEIDGSEISKLQEKSEVVIWTPGSTAGRGLNLVGSLQAPKGASDPATRADEIAGSVGGLLRLVGIDSDPMSGREHIFLSNLVERAWAAGSDLGLDQLVAQVFDPPFRKMGVLDLDAFYPPKDRSDLGMKLNGLLASPAFAVWGAGEPLDIAAMLHNPTTGKARASVVSIAHLSDEERQFAVAKILSALITWMRGQSGTTSLRALLYIDEVLGYVPPNGNPPTKAPILTLVKQARAFGVGVVLATQNPVDVDYKVLSNATTWMVGRLQTERDRDRLLEGMRSAAGSIDITQLSATISGLAKREFVLQRAGVDTPAIFNSRWAMSYLRGPLTGKQITALGAAGGLGGPEVPSASATATVTSGAASGSSTAGGPAPVATADDEVTMAPPVAQGIATGWTVSATSWLGDVGGSPNSTTYSPALAVRLNMLFDDTAADLRDEHEWEAVVHPIAQVIDTDAIFNVDHDDRDFTEIAPEGAIYVLPDAKIDSATWFKTAQTRIVEHVVSTQTMTMQRNEALKLWSRPGETPDQFTARCDVAAQEQADAETAKLRTTLEARIERVKDAIDTAERRVGQQEQEHKASRTNEIIAGAGVLLGAFLGGRRSTRSIGSAVRGASGRHATSSRESAQADAAADALADKSTQLTELEQELADKLFEIDAKWDTVAGETTETTVPLEKTDVRVVDVKLVWIPVTR
jgi:Helicase HerA, central domain